VSMNILDPKIKALYIDVRKWSHNFFWTAWTVMNIFQQL
jgi:hypothetical protein